jgi:hypothetical protein
MRGKRGRGGMIGSAIRRAERGLEPPRLPIGRLGATGVISIVLLGIIFALGGLLDVRGASAEVRKFAEWAERSKRKPLEALVNGARSRRFVFLSDIHGSSETKRLAAAAVEAVARGPGLDAVVLEVGHDLQPVIDRYLDTSPENASILLAQPRVLGSPAGGSRGLLDLYHKIWQLNSDLGADRRIHIIAADLDGWGSGRAESPAERARRFVQRDSAMVKNLETELLTSAPRSRVLIFMTGLHGLENSEAQLQTGGVATVQGRWFAGRLAERYPGEVYSFLVDASGNGSPEEVVPYNGTRIPETVKTRLPGGQFALPIGSQFDVFSHAVRENSIPGIRFEIVPRQYKLRDVADEYIYLGR